MLRLAPLSKLLSLAAVVLLATGLTGCAAGEGGDDADESALVDAEDDIAEDIELAVSEGEGDLVDGDDNAEDPEADETTGVTAAALKNGVSGKKYKCPGYTRIACQCIQSKFNCQLPNTQRGRNRYLRPDGSNLWPIQPGTELRDGAGNLRAVVADPAVKINYGQRKALRGQSGTSTNHVYAFAVNNYTLSGWIEESRITAPFNMPTVDMRNPGGGRTTYYVRGGVKGWLVGKDYKVVPRSNAANEAATDYVDRGGVVNLLYALPRAGGVSNDTVPVGSVFRRAANVETMYVPLYKKGSARSNGLKLRFMYGEVDGRYGWIAYDALSTRRP